MDDLQQGRTLLAEVAPFIVIAGGGAAKYGYVGRQIVSVNCLSPVSRPYRDHPHLHAATVNSFGHPQRRGSVDPIASSGDTAPLWHGITRGRDAPDKGELGHVINAVKRNPGLDDSDFPIDDFNADLVALEQGLLGVSQVIHIMDVGLYARCFIDSH
ncbi:hypothetical protein NKDENANG_02704 [Candidatus Entotheonellaceae bacterium PAL068K]